MVLKYYFPKKNYSFSKLDKISAHVKGKWTWQGASLLAFAKMGFEVVNIENLDYKKFAKDGDVYLKSIWSKEVFDTQDEFSNLKQEQRIARKLVAQKNITLLNKEASLDLIEFYIKKGFIVLVSINPCVLERKNCYWSHIGIVTGINKKTVTFHDPGLPGYLNRQVDKKLFEKSMTKPWKEDMNIIALKYSK